MTTATVSGIEYRFSVPSEAHCASQLLSRRRLRILVVDENSADVVLIRRCVNEGTWSIYPEVDAASSSSEALELLAARQYDVLLVASCLPRGGSYELLGELSRRGLEVPVLLIGQPGQEKAALEAIKAGAMDYLDRTSLTSRSLVSTIRFAVNLRHKENLRRQAEEALRVSESEYRNLFENANDAILICDPKTEVVLEANRRACELYGISKEQLVGLSLRNFAADRSREGGQFLNLLQDRVNRAFERVHFRIDGSRVELLMNASIVDYRGRAAVMAISRDVTAHKKAEAQVERLAYHDPLTGLANRVLFGDRLDMALSQARRAGHPAAVLFLDLDRFKLVNDSLGHSGGDLLLRRVAERLRDLVRGGDTLARIGGDEFLLLLYRIDSPEDAGIVARKVLRLLREPFLVARREVYVTASIGISVFPLDGGDGEALVKNADAAMYGAKQQGRDCFRFYERAMEEGARDRLSLDTDLHKAVAGDQIRVFYQPRVHLKSGRITGMEALVRWQHPERGLLLPGDFISQAEESGMILPIGMRVLRTACARASSWRQAGHGDLVVSVNLSVRQIREPGIVDAVAAVLDETGLPPSGLELELTESIAMDNVETTLARLERFKAMGIRITMDDFGTGYSSLSYLKMFPIDTVKIDKSFVDEVTTNADDASIAQACILMSHGLGMAVVAEGVETEEQRAFLERHCCDEGQGFLFGRPLPPEEFEVRLREDGGRGSTAAEPIP